MIDLSFHSIQKIKASQSESVPRCIDLVIVMKHSEIELSLFFSNPTNAQDLALAINSIWPE